ncbi:MAG: HD domain-containing protein [Erysipelotrichia bacterium]|nr:HD domain-containing protein [Erysipelotrichia bacterium]NCC54473.1 HD domain-containing protein [Erysipelotrichia bacterium]
MYAKKAYELAKQAHKGQVDKAGKEYINHPCAVAKMVDTDIEKAVAYLHDVVEDTDITLEYLSTIFPVEIINAVDAITKRVNEPYEQYLSRVESNAIAKKVKIADMTHNSMIKRFSNPSDKDYQRVDKYKKELKRLKRSN